MSTEQFVDPSYEAPSSGGGYTTIEQGDNRFRILSSPLMVWVIWNDGKPLRVPYNKDKKPTLPTGENPSVKHAWLLIVYNYKTESIEVMELDKMTVIRPLLTHAQDPDWGHPKHYDVVIKKEGSGKDNTKYSFIAKPKSEVIQEIKDAYFDTPIDLEELLKPDGNPFLPKPGDTEAEAPAQKPEPKPEPRPEPVADKPKKTPPPF